MRTQRPPSRLASIASIALSVAFDVSPFRSVAMASAASMIALCFAGDAAVSLFSEGLETTDPGMGTVHGLAPFREYLETLRRAMPDARAVVEHSHHAGDTVAVEGRFVGTHTGPLATPDGEIGPTGATVDLRFADVSTVRDGKIASYHTYYDQLGLLTQLGLTST